MNDHVPFRAVTTTSAWLTRRQAAEHAHVSEATIGREVRAGRLQCARVGGRRSMRFRPEWVDAWLQGGLEQELASAA